MIWFPHREDECFLWMNGYGDNPIVINIFNMNYITAKRIIHIKVKGMEGGKK